jgi:biotin operon repressor
MELHELLANALKSTLEVHHGRVADPCRQWDEPSTSRLLDDTERTRTLDMTILLILAGHKGRDNPISSADLRRELGIFQVDELQVHERVNHLRRSGFLIGSTAGQNGGYYTLSSREAFDDFIGVDFMGEIIDMCRTALAMSGAADSKWGASDERWRIALGEITEAGGADDGPPPDSHNVIVISVQ